MSSREQINSHLGHKQTGKVLAAIQTANALLVHRSFCFATKNPTEVTTKRRLCGGCESRAEALELTMSSSDSSEDLAAVFTQFLPSCDDCGTCNGLLLCKWCAKDFVCVPNAQED